MPQRAIPAVFMRGGTSKGLFFHRRDLPADPAEWDPVFLAAIGSPDPYGRQLDGMGGGISSLSKVMVVAPSSRPSIDAEYTFGQVAVGEALVDYGANCGNLTSAIGPFAVDEGLVEPADGEAVLRLYNTNTDKVIEARFEVRDGRALVEGGQSIPGVAGEGAPIRLDFLDPGGASTGRLLPTGRPLDRLQVPGDGAIEASIIDATTTVAFVRAADLGLSGAELPDELEAMPDLLARLEAIRQAAAKAAGLPASGRSVPKLGIVAPPQAARTLAGERLAADAMQLTARIMSMGRPHRALPLTGALCTAVAAAIEGTLAAEARDGDGDLVLAQPSGLMRLSAEVERRPAWRAARARVLRTARRLMEGRVLVPEGRLERSAAAPLRLTAEA
jgi:2-methylaconitate isomerase